MDGEVDFVYDYDNGFVFRREFVCKFYDFKLVFDVKVVCWFVKYKNFRFLC